jgi:hypothetical protein
MKLFKIICGTQPTFMADPKPPKKPTPIIFKGRVLNTDLFKKVGKDV